MKNSKKQYPDAGKNAPEGVQEEIAEYHAMSQEYKDGRPLLYHILGSGTPPYKMSKEDSDYSATTPIQGEICGNCIFAYQNVVRKSFICSQIRGRIKLEAWCRLWKGERES